MRDALSTQAACGSEVPSLPHVLAACLELLGGVQCQAAASAFISGGRQHSFILKEATRMKRITLDPGLRRPRGLAPAG